MSPGERLVASVQESYDTHRHAPETAPVAVSVQPTGHPPFTPLLADMLSAMIADGHATANALIAALTVRAEQAEAELEAVRDGVLGLLAGPWMPMPAAIEQALLPSAEAIAQFRKDGEQR
jgi:hypothetical protein